MVHAPVEYQHALDSMGVLGVPGGDDDVVVQTITHALVGEGVVTGRPAVDEHPANRAVYYGINGGDGAARCQQGDFIAARTDRRMFPRVSATFSRQLPDTFDVFGGMEYREFFDRRRARFDTRHERGKPGQIE